MTGIALDNPVRVSKKSEINHRVRSILEAWDKERRALRVTQDDAADAAKVSRPTLGRWFTKYNAREETVTMAIVRFCKHYGVDASKILGGPPPPLLVREGTLRPSGMEAVPLLHDIAAGGFSSIEQVGEIDVPTEMYRPTRFAARVIGNSMATRIEHGDLLVFHPSAENLVGLIWYIEDDDHGAAVKVLGHKDGKYVPEPVNPAYGPPQVNRWKLVGYLVGIIRELAGGEKVIFHNERGIRP